jgi:hypothetical protein
VLNDSSCLATDEIKAQLLYLRRAIILFQSSQDSLLILRSNRSC